MATIAANQSRSQVDANDRNYLWANCMDNSSVDPWNPSEALRTFWAAECGLTEGAVNQWIGAQRSSQLRQENRRANAWGAAPMIGPILRRLFYVVLWTYKRRYIAFSLPIDPHLVAFVVAIIAFSYHAYLAYLILTHKPVNVFDAFDIVFRHTSHLRNHLRSVNGHLGQPLPWHMEHALSRLSKVDTQRVYQALGHETVIGCHSCKNEWDYVVTFLQLSLWEYGLAGMMTAVLTRSKRQWRSMACVALFMLWTMEVATCLWKLSQEHTEYSQITAHHRASVLVFRRVGLFLVTGALWKPW